MNNNLCPHCGGEMPTPDRISVWYMHDNHTFTKIKNNQVEAILERARHLGRESPHGMLCPVILLYGEKEIRRVGPSVHAKHELDDTSEWEAAIRDDPDALRLLENPGGGDKSRSQAV